MLYNVEYMIRENSKKGFKLLSKQHIQAGSLVKAIEVCHRACLDKENNRRALMPGVKVTGKVWSTPVADV